MEKGISELGNAYRMAAEKVLDFDHMDGHSYLEQTTLWSPKTIRIRFALSTPKPYLQRRCVIWDRKGLIST